MKHIFDDPEYDDEDEREYGIAGWLFLAGMVIIGAMILYLCQSPPQAQHKPPESFSRGVEEDKRRGSKWESVRKEFLRAHPLCAYCGGTERLQVHHVHQFDEMTDAQRGTDSPGGEYDFENLITLCEVQPEDHHLRIGHSGNFKTSNPNVKADCVRHEAEMRAAGTWPQR